MKKRTKVIAAGASALALAAGGTGMAVAGGVGDRGENANGPGAKAAEAAALKLTGGHANSVERDSENGATWEAEVTKPDGNTVDVRLDESYKLVVIEGDSEAK